MLKFIIKSTLIIIVLIILAIAGCIGVSKFARAKINALHDEYLTWTEENIVENPQLYFDACKEEFERVLLELKADELAAVRSIVSIEHLRDNAEAAIRDGEKAYAELVALYPRENARWPVGWHGRTLDENAYEWQVIHLSEDLENKCGELRRHAETLEELKSRPAEAARARSQIMAERAKFLAQREHLRAKQANADTARQILNIRSMLQSVSGLMGVEDAAVPLGVDDLQTGAGRSEAERKEAFRKAMGW